MPQIDLDGPAKTRTRRLDVALAVAVACATVFAACGSSARTPEAKHQVSTAAQIPGDGPSGGEADSAAVEAAVGDFMTAFAAGNGEKACALMTDKAVAGVVDDGKDRTVDEAFDTCIDAVEMFSEVMDDADRAQLRDAEFTDTKVDGDTATVTVSVDGSTIELERSDEGWLLAESPVS